MTKQARKLTRRRKVRRIYSKPWLKICEAKVKDKEMDLEMVECYHKIATYQTQKARKALRRAKRELERERGRVNDEKDKSQAKSGN